MSPATQNTKGGTPVTASLSRHRTAVWRCTVVEKVPAALHWARTIGVNPVDVYIHGLGGGADDFSVVARHHPLTGRDALLIDLLGHGRSDRPEMFSYTVEDHAEVVCSLLDDRTRAGDRFGGAVVGHSMGGAIAVLVAAMRPDLFTRVVLAEPNLVGGKGLLSGRITEQDEATLVAEGMARIVDLLGTTAAERMRRCDPRAIHRSAFSLVRGCSPEIIDRLNALPHERIVLIGSRSSPYRDEAMIRRPGIPIVVVPDAGRHLMHDNPAGFADAVIAALGH